MEKTTPRTISVLAGSAAPRNELAAFEAMKVLGRTIALQGAALLIPTQRGIPLWAAMGAKEAGGVVIGLSPAISAYEHEYVHRLPQEYVDTILYVGDEAIVQAMCVRSARAVVVGSGPLSTPSLFTRFGSDGANVGILKGAWHDMTEHDREMPPGVHTDTDPERLIRKIAHTIVGDGGK